MVIKWFDSTSGHMSNEIIKVTAAELSLVQDNCMNPAQLKLLLQKTPKHYIKKRPAKGGGEWDYVSGGYVRKVLNLMFGWDWDFEILSEMIRDGEVIVKGKLTCRANGRTIVKTQYGKKEIVFKKGTEIPLSIGNDLKSAATDSLKKCAADLGIAGDVYNKNEFRELDVTPMETPDEVNDRKEMKRLNDWLESVKTIDELKQVEQSCSMYGMLPQYNAKMEQLCKK